MMISDPFGNPSLSWLASLGHSLCLSLRSLFSLFLKSFSCRVPPFPGPPPLFFFDKERKNSGSGPNDLVIESPSPLSWEVMSEILHTCLPTHVLGAPNVYINV